jgi:hypothetical protein
MIRRASRRSYYQASPLLKVAKRLGIGLLSVPYMVHPKPAKTDEQVSG